MAYDVERKIGKYRYKYTVEAYRDPETGKPRQRVLKYHGRVDDAGRVVVPAAVRVDEVRSAFPIGGLALFVSAGNRIDLAQHVADALEVAPEVAAHVVCLALNQIGARRSLQDLPGWVRRSPLPRWLSFDAEPLDRDTFDRALHAINRVEDGLPVDKGLVLQEKLTRTWRNGSREPAQFYYDVTRQVYRGGHCPYAEPGYFPGGRRQNVLGFGMVTSRWNHHPVLCRPIPGSRNDTVTVQDIVNELKGWGYDRLTLIMDRGMVSKGNVEFIHASGFEQVGIVPESNREAWDYLVRWAEVDLRKPRFLVERSERKAVYLRAWETSLLGRKRMKVVLVEDAVRGAEEGVSRDLLVSRATKTTDPVQLRKLREDLGYLAVTAKGRRGFAVDTKAAREDRVGDGRFLMFSTDLSMDAEEIFRAYFQRDEIEKAFRTMKGELSLGPIRYRTREKIEAYTTVVYVAYLLWSLVQRTLREKLGSLSVSGALKLLEDVHWVRFGSGKTEHEWVTKLSSEQERVLKALGAVPLLRSG